MKKSDLKNGMVVEFEDGERGMAVNDRIITQEYFLELANISESLKSPCIGCTITKVYVIEDGFTFKKLNNLNHLNLIWERKQRIDWTKVPRGTMIKIKDCKDEEWEERELIAYLGDDINATHKFICKSKINKGQYYHWKYATIDNPKREWLK